MGRPHTPHTGLVATIVIAVVVCSYFYFLSYVSSPKGGDESFVMAREDRGDVRGRTGAVPRPRPHHFSAPKFIPPAGQGHKDISTTPYIVEDNSHRPNDLVALMHKKKLLVAMHSAPEHADIRDLFRNEMTDSAYIQILFVVDGAPHEPEMAKYLQAEKKVFNDLLILPSRNLSASPDAMLRYVLAHSPADVDFVLTAKDDVLLFVDIIYARLLELITTGVPSTSGSQAPMSSGHIPAKKELLGGIDAWTSVCLLRTRKQEYQAGSARCNFGDKTMPSTVYEWIGGRCKSDTVYYLRNNGPMEVLRNFGRRVYIETRKTKSPCRADWLELESHNKVWIQMLQAWSSFANRHGLKWFLMSGPLIGAWRHQGFVPYDPDIDIMLLPESVTDFVKFMLMEEAKLPFFLLRREHDYLHVNREHDGFIVKLPANPHDIAPYFRRGCVENCWDAGPLIGKVHHKHSCYGGEWTGGYVMDVFILPPKDMPERLSTCIIEGLAVPCPADIDTWMTREIGSDWKIPQDDPNKKEILKLSNPFMSCQELGRPVPEM